MNQCRLCFGYNHQAGCWPVQSMHGLGSFEALSIIVVIIIIIIITIMLIPTAIVCNDVRRLQHIRQRGQQRIPPAATPTPLHSIHDDADGLVHDGHVIVLVNHRDVERRRSVGRPLGGVIVGSDAALESDDVFGVHPGDDLSQLVKRGAIVSGAEDATIAAHWMP